MSSPKVTKTVEAAYVEPKRIEDRKVIQAPEKSVKDGLAFFLASEQARLSATYEDDMFLLTFPEAVLNEMQQVFCVGGSTEDIQQFAARIWQLSRSV